MAPNLQRVQGCFTDAPRVFAQYAGYDFKRCPLTYHLPAGMAFVRRVNMGGRKPRTAKGEEAWRYVEFLNKLYQAREEAEQNGNR
jgi:hypothetical protein